MDRKAEKTQKSESKYEGFVNKEDTNHAAAAFKRTLFAGR